MYTFTIYARHVLIVIRYFFFEKHAFNGLLKVIGLVFYFRFHLCDKNTVHFLKKKLLLVSSFEIHVLALSVVYYR